MIKKSKKTRALAMNIVNGSPDKKAGSNRVILKVSSSDWRVPESEVRMTIRDAQSLRSFLNEYLEG